MLGFNHQKVGFRSKPKRYRNRNVIEPIETEPIEGTVYVTRSSVQHGLWALKTEATWKPTYRTMLKSDRLNRDLPLQRMGLAPRGFELLKAMRMFERYCGVLRRFAMKKPR